MPNFAAKHPGVVLANGRGFPILVDDLLVVLKQRYGVFAIHIGTVNSGLETLHDAPQRLQQWKLIAPRTLTLPAAVPVSKLEY